MLNPKRKKKRERFNCSQTTKVAELQPNRIRRGKCDVHVRASRVPSGSTSTTQPKHRNQQPSLSSIVGGSVGGWRHLLLSSSSSPIPIETNSTAGLLLVLPNGNNHSSRLPTFICTSWANTFTIMNMRNNEIFTCKDLTS